MVAKLNDEQRQAGLAELTLWVHDNASDSITRTFKFKDFSEAFGFMTRAAMLAEAADHHPDWSNIYNRVTIVLSTHDAHGLSHKDLSLAKAIDKLVA